MVERVPVRGVALSARARSNAMSCMPCRIPVETQRAGFLPDVRMGPVMGVLLDEHHGVSGYQRVFLAPAGFALPGLLVTLVFRRVAR